MIGFSLTAITGLVMLAASVNPHVKYAGTFLFACEIYPNVPQGVAWNGNNIGGSTKRGVGIAIHVGFGNFGGVLASFVYLFQDCTSFHPGALHFDRTVLDECMSSNIHDDLPPAGKCSERRGSQDA